MAESTPQESTNKKTGSVWIPLESNPEVFNTYAKKMGLADTAAFEDIYGLDSELLDMVPQPVKAVLLIFPITDESEEKRKAQDVELEKQGQPHLDETSVIFIKQKISNACGTIGLLHALMNAGVTIDPASTLTTFLHECMDKTPEERADILAETTLFAAAHEAAATSAESTSVVPEDLSTNLHFTAFVQSPSAEKPDESRLIELDGRRPGPIDHGESKKLLEDVAKIVKEKYMSLSTSMHFGMVALSGK